MDKYFVGTLPESFGQHTPIFLGKIEDAQTYTLKDAGNTTVIQQQKQLSKSIHV